MNRTRATATGFIAVLLWSLLAVFTVGFAPVPPLQLNAMCFVIGGTIGLIWIVARGQIGTLRHVPLKVYAFGTLGLFGYHVLYFSALRMAPPAQAGLIAYLWPLFIVLLSGLLPGERLKLGHLGGAILGFAGATMIIWDGGNGFSSQFAPGYALAMLCAVTWSGYSVLSRLFGTVPTASVAVFCLGSAALSFPLHFILETTTIPASLTGWLAILGLGAGPVGLAFYVWDIGVKQGDIQLLGISSYAAPLLSTGVLIGVGIAPPSWSLIWAALLITGGAALAARASFRKG